MPTLDWIGKSKVVNHHLDVPYRILERQYSFDDTGLHAEDNGSENMIIHGDNLEALKSLLPEYEGKIKCIYIDPPYNTAKSTDSGRQWVYNDNVDHPKIKAWIGKIVGDEETDFTRHDKWLCMMYPRLKLLHKLLAKDGVIFISIDDNELSNLQLICNEIFGVKNHIKTFIWYNNDGHKDNQDNITGVHEYIFCYAKNKELLCYNNVVDPNIPADSKILRDFAENSITKNGGKNPPSRVVLPAGFPCEIESLLFSASENIDAFILDVKETGYISRELTQKYSMKYPVRIDSMIVEDFKLTSPCTVYSGWMNVGKLKKFIENDCQPIVDGDTMLRFYLSKNGAIYYYRSGRSSHYIQTVLENMGTTETNKYMIEKMGLKFDYPKPVALIQYLISFFTQPGDIILDSFAGSGTTAHAILNMNKADGGNRKFILVEMMDYADTITAERVKQVINGYEYEVDKKETLYDIKITIENIDIGEDLLVEANNVVKKAKEKYAVVNEPTIENGHLSVVAVSKAKDFMVGTSGSFSYYELGDTLMENGKLNENIGIEKIREYVYFTETKTRPMLMSEDEPYLLGMHFGSAYYFYYDKENITTLNRAFLSTVKTKAENYVMYADLCTLSNAELEKYHITFKKIPRDITKL